MFTRTVTLSGPELSSFLAAGGMTVNPTSLRSSQSVAAAAAAARSSSTQAPFFGFGAVPTTTTMTTTTPSSSSSSSSSSTTRGPMATSSAAVSAAAPRASSSTPVVESTTTTAAPTTTAAAAVANQAQAATTTPAQRATAANVIASARRTTTSSSGVPAAQVALNAGSAGAKNTAAISSGGIAGLIIGLMLLAGIAAAGLLYLGRKRREKRRLQNAFERSQRDRRNEKGAMRLEEENVGNVGNVGPESGARAPGTPGFNFGVLPAIAPAGPMTTGDHYQRSASPAEMHRGAAVLGIQRPYTPPPGHPSHPLYMAPASLRQGNSRSTTPNSQMSSRNVNYVSDPGMRSDMSQQSAPGQVPRSIVPIVAPFALPGHSSGFASNSPYANQEGLAPALQRENALSKSDSSREPTTRASGQSFSPGDENPESFDAVSPRTDTATSASALAGASHFERTRSVLQATDGWAQRKAQLKNTLASSTNSASPAVEQSPFADPAPLIHQDISSAPMDIQFGEQNSVSVR